MGLKNRPNRLWVAANVLCALIFVSGFLVATVLTGPLLPEGKPVEGSGNTLAMVYVAASLLVTPLVWVFMNARLLPRERTRRRGR